MIRAPVLATELRSTRRTGRPPWGYDPGGGKAWAARLTPRQRHRVRVVALNRAMHAMQAGRPNAANTWLDVAAAT